MTNYILLIFMTLLGALGSYFLKKSTQTPGFIHIIKSPNFYAGGFLYFSSAIINVYILRFLDFSVVLPLTSITYIWTMILAKILLNEKITKRKYCGLFLIIIGAIFISK